jgi:hypothetical protein
VSHRQLLSRRVKQGACATRIDIRFVAVCAMCLAMTHGKYPRQGSSSEAYPFIDAKRTGASWQCSSVAIGCRLWEAWRGGTACRGLVQGPLSIIALGTAVLCPGLRRDMTSRVGWNGALISHWNVPRSVALSRLRSRFSNFVGEFVGASTRRSGRDERLGSGSVLLGRPSDLVFVVRAALEHRGEQLAVVTQLLLQADLRRVVA